MSLPGWKKWLPGFLVLALLAMPATQVCGQGQVREKVELDEDFWESTARRHAGAAAQMLTINHPLSMAIMRVRGWELKVWNEPEFAAEAGALPLNAEWFDVTDEDGRPLPNIVGKAPDEISPPQMNLYNLYNQALIYAFRTPREAFAHSAKENHYVKFGHMYREPWKYRGKVIHVEGRMRRLRLLDATKKAQMEGVKFIGEGWIFTETYGTNPVVFIFPVSNPKEVREGENIDRWVAFDGYFILKYKYAAKDKERKTLLFIGPGLTNKPAPVAEVGQSVPLPFLYGIVAFVALAGFGLLGLSWWFRRGDIRVRAHLAQLQQERVLEQMEGGREDISPPDHGPGLPPERRF